MDGYLASRKVRKLVKQAADAKKIKPGSLKSYSRKQIETIVNEGTGRRDSDTANPIRLPRIIAITGHVEQEYIKKAEENGIDMVFPKPLPIL